MMEDETFFRRLGLLQGKSIEAVSEAYRKHRIGRDLRLPFYGGAIANEDLDEAVRLAANGREDPKFLDPYCGDGTSLILARYAGLEAYGTDDEKGLLDIADENITRATAWQMIDREQRPVLDVNGLLDLDGYREKLGIGIEDIDVFFLHLEPGQVDPFTQLFAEQARDGARMIFPRTSSNRRDVLEGNLRDVSDGKIRLYVSKDSGETDDHGRELFSYLIYQNG